MTHWGQVPLKHLVELNPEALPEDTDPGLELRYVDIGSVGRGVMLLQPEVMTFAAAPSRARRIVRRGDVIISTVRTYLRAVLPIGEGEDGLVVSTGFAVVRPRMLYPGYAAWLMQSDLLVEEVVARSVGISYPAISPSDIGMVKVPVPSQPDQRAIAEFLDLETARIDALIAAKRRMVALLEERCEAIINRRLEGVAPWIPLSRVLASERDSLIAGPFGSDLSGPDLQAEGPVAVFDQEVVIAAAFDSPRNFVGPAKATALRRFKARPGDVLVTGRGTIGRVAVTPTDVLDGIIHPCLLRVRTDPRKLLPEFLALALAHSFRVRDYFRLESTATTIDVIYGATLAGTPVPVPTIGTQKELMVVVGAVEVRSQQASAALSRQIQVLAERRRALITAAVTGEMEIPVVAA